MALQQRVAGDSMPKFEPQQGAYLNTLMLLASYRFYGIHPVVMPWQYVDKSPKELLETFEHLDDSPEEDVY